ESINPLRAASWPQWIRAAGDGSTAQQAFDQLAEALGTASMAIRTEDGEITWGQLVNIAEEEFAKSEVILLADRAGLARGGLTPRVAIKRLTGTGKQDRGVALLKQAKLIAIASRNQIVLTSQAAAAHFQPQLTSPDRGVFRETLNGSLADE